MRSTEGDFGEGLADEPYSGYPPKGNELRLDWSRPGEGKEQRGSTSIEMKGGFRRVS